MLHFRRVLGTKLDRYYRIMRHCTMIATIGQTGFIGLLPTQELNSTFDEVFAYHQIVNRTLRNNILFNGIEMDFLLRMAEEVRRCISVLGEIQNTTTNDGDFHRYWSTTNNDNGTDDSTDDSSEQMIFMASNRQPFSTGDPSNINSWGVDSGATRQFTHSKNDLLNPTPCNISVTIADGSVVQGTFQGDVKINIITKRGVPSTLTLKNVVYIEGLNRRLFSVMAFCKNQNYYITFNSHGGTLHFGDGNSVQTTYAPFQSNEQGMQITDDHLADDPVEVDSSEEGESRQPVKESQQNITNNLNSRRDNVKTKDIEQFHHRLGFIPLRDLLMGS